MTEIKKFRTLLAIALFVGISTASFAQFSIGGRAGVNLNNLRGESVIDNKMLIGYNIGGFVNYSMIDLMTGDLAEIMSLQGEFTVQTKGANAEYLKNDAEGNDEIYNPNQVFTYVQVPILAKFTFPATKTLSVYGEGGFFLAALFGLTMDGEKSWNHDDDGTTDTRKYREEYSGFDAGFAIGGGASIPFGGRNSPWEAYLGLRYSMGLMNIGEPKKNTAESMVKYVEDVKTSTLSILVGVCYKL